MLTVEVRTKGGWCTVKVTNTETGKVATEKRFPRSELPSRLEEIQERVR